MEFMQGLLIGALVTTLLLTVLDEFGDDDD